VREVVAHLIATAQMTPPRFFVKLAASGFQFRSMAAKDILRRTAGHDRPQRGA
jgi:hypothetical protein